MNKAYNVDMVEALTDAVVYDVGGQTEWFTIFRDRSSIRAADPARFADPERMRELKFRHNCEIRAISGSLI